MIFLSPIRRCTGIVFVCLLFMLTCGAFGSNTATPDLVVRAGKQVSAFLAEFSEISCIENVTQIKLKGNGKAEYQEDSSFDYLLLTDDTGGELTLTESRLEKQTAQHKKHFAMLVTNGFATMQLIFSANYRSSFTFSEPQPELVNGKPLMRVHFRHITGKMSPTALLLHGRDYPLDLEGDAWIDPRSANIVRITTDLAEPMTDVGLRIFRSDVSYAPVDFKSIGRTAWVPTRAIVEVESTHQHWRNVHRFDHYAHFDVSTQEADSKKP